MANPSEKLKFDNLVKQINQHNTVQQIKKQELGLLPNIWSSNNAGMYRQRFYALQGNETGLDQVSREQIVRLSRELFFQLPGIGVASELKSEYVVGDHWDFTYKGKNKKWGEIAENFINNKWFNSCSNKGFAYDFQTILKNLSYALDMDGDVLMVFVRDNNGYPKLQFVGSHRLGSFSGNMTGNDGTKVEMNGKEYKCFDGIVYDENNKVVAYAVKPDEAQLNTVPPAPKVEKKPTVIPVEHAQLIFKPLVLDKYRGLPALYSSVLYGLQIQDLDNFLMDIAKIEATIAYISTNDTGQAPVEYENLMNSVTSFNQESNMGVNLPTVSPTVHGISMVKTPTINYAKADGGKIESFSSDRPSEQIQAYIRTIETKLLSAIGIPHQLIYSPETISGRAVNAISQLVKKSVYERQKLLKKYAKLAVAWALSVAMEEGYIPANYDEDINDIVDFTLPPEFTLDTNQDNTANLELYKVGLMSGEQYCRANNTSFEDIQTKRKTEIKRLLADIEEVKKQYPNMSETAILNLFTQRGTSTLTIDDKTEEQPKP